MFQKSLQSAQWDKYLSKEARKLLAIEPPPEAGQQQEREVTILVSDLLPFNAASELLSAPKLAQVINHYLDGMSHSIIENHGFIERYLGNSISALFGAPVPCADHADRACRSLIGMMNAQLVINQQFAEQGLPAVLTAMKTTYGLATGRVMVGNFGCSQKYQYSMMGDTVNLAMRLQSGTRAYGAMNIVSQATVDVVDADRYVFRYLDRIMVKGRSQPLTIYELIGYKVDISPDIQQCLDVYARAMDSLLKRKWKEAALLFGEGAQMEWAGQPTSPSAVYVARCLQYQEDPPPEDWDGVFVMRAK